MADKFPLCAGSKLKYAASASVFVAFSVALSACSTAPGSSKVRQVAKVENRQKSKEYFSQAEYGVAASPRVVNVATVGTKAKRLPRGGGRAQVGKPYKVKGKWYTPRLDPDYQATGTASWYGDAFHGRLTANGEIYDMNHLSAAHPTMPLPSYAKVTNTKNGNSVIVRVNDRGPYAHNRLIDLSKRTAQLLDFTHSGTAQVKVEYIGPAPVHGQDDEFLIASFQPGNDITSPGASEQPVMVASAEAGMDPSLPGVNAFAENVPAAASANLLPAGLVRQPRAAVAASAGIEPVVQPGAMPVVPAVAPMPANRPDVCITLEPCEDDNLRGMVSSYASERIESAHRGTAFDVLNTDGAVEADWKAAQHEERILIGTLNSQQAKELKSALLKKAEISFESNGNGTLEVSAAPVMTGDIDALLKTIWHLGYRDAFVIR